MHPATTALVATVRAADRVSPGLAGRLALPLFRQVRPALPVRPADRAVHEHAERGTITVRGRELVTYAWGRGPETVLVVHGWRGRASQFAPIVRELRAEGYRVVGFDAPANGDSAGRRTDIRDYLAAIEAMQQRHGMFRVVIGHSFGALAALTAVREGTAAGGVVAIAGMADARYLVDSFAARVGVGAATADVLAGEFARRVVPDVPEPYARVDAVARPAARRRAAARRARPRRSRGRGIRVGATARGPRRPLAPPPHRRSAGTPACSAPMRRSTR